MTRRWRPGEPFELNTRSWQFQGLVGLYPAFHRAAPGSLSQLIAGGSQVGQVANPGLTSDAEFGPTRSYNGSSQYFLSTTTPLTGLPLTIAAWVRPSAATAEGTIFAITNSGSTNNYYTLHMRGQDVGDPYTFIARGGSTGQANAAVGATVGQWAHVAGVAVSTSERHCYVNGGNKGTNTTSSGAISGLNRVSLGALARSSIGQFWPGLIAEVRVYSRAFSDLEVAALYAEQTRWELYAPARRRVWFVPAGAATYTGSGAPTLPALVGTGTGTFTAPQYTGTGTPALPTITGAGAGTFTTPTYTGTGAPALPAATATGTGTFTAPTYIGTGAPLLPAATAAGSGVFTAPVYTGSGAPVLPALAGSGAGLFAADIYSGAGVAPLPAVVAAGAGAFTAPTYTGAGAPILPALVGAGLGAFSAPVYTGSGSAALSAITGAGVGTFTPGIAYTPGGRQVEYVPARVRRMEVAQRTRLARIAARIRSREAT